MRGCSRWNSAGGLPETSNCYCHPGRAGGSPAYARKSGKKPRLETKKSLLVHNYELFLYRQTRLHTAAYASHQTESDEISEKRQLLILDDLTIFAISARRLLELCGLRSKANSVRISPVVLVDPDADVLEFSHVSAKAVGFESLLNHLLHMSNFMYFDDPEHLRIFTGRSRSVEELILHYSKVEQPFVGVFIVYDKRNGAGIYLLKDLVEASITVAEKIIDVCADGGVYLDFSMKG